MKLSGARATHHTRREDDVNVFTTRKYHSGNLADARLGTNREDSVISDYEFQNFRLIEPLDAGDNDTKRYKASAHAKKYPSNRAVFVLCAKNVLER